MNIVCAKHAALHLRCGSRQLCMRESWPLLQDIDIEVDSVGNVNATMATVEAGKGAKARARSAERQLRRVEHRVTALTALVRGLLLDCAADSSAVQAAVLSLVPPELVEQLGVCGGAKDVESGGLAGVCSWMHRTFTVADEQENATDYSTLTRAEYCAMDLTGNHDLRGRRTEEDDLFWGMVQDVRLPEGQRGWMKGFGGEGGASMVARAIAVQLLMCVQRRRGGELHVAAVFVALLRACGRPTRLVANFQVRLHCKQINWLCQLC
jgi:hypothetical protein